MHQFNSTPRPGLKEQAVYMIAMAILVEIIAIQLFPKIVQPKGEAGISTLCLLCKQMEDLNQDTIKMKKKGCRINIFLSK